MMVLLGMEQRGMDRSDGPCLGGALVPMQMGMDRSDGPCLGGTFKIV